MATEPDKISRTLNRGAREGLLRRNWHSHDSRWYLKVASECGFDVANRLNQAVAKSMGRTEMKRMLEATRSGKISTAEDFAGVVTIVCELYYPPPLLEGEIEVIGGDSLTCITTKCYGFEEVRKAGGIGTYECACGHKNEGWLEGCGLKGKVRIVRSMMRGDPVCEISISSISRSFDDDPPL